MTHLKIELNNGVIEEVSSAVIDKLYDIVHSGNLDQTSNLIGRLHTSATYQDYIDYLEDTFKVNGVKLLIIDATKKYIMFADPAVASYWANSTYGDGTGIDSTSAASVLSIPNNAFKNNTSILTFDELGRYFPNCTTINYYAFNKTSNLTSIDLSNITTIGLRAFDSSGLSGVLNLPKVNVLEEGCFALTNDVTEINIGADLSDNNKITILDQNVFNHSGQNDNLLQKVTGLNKVLEIKSNAFYNCRQLLSIDTTSELTTIRDGAFSYCISLECIDISNVTLIENTALAYCYSLVDLATNNPTLINTGAATYTLNWSTIPTSVFAGDPLNNKSFSFPNATSIGTSAFNSTKIVSIYIPNVTTISTQGFRNCTSLTTVNIPNCTTIGNQSFSECTSLTTVNNSDNVTRINQYAFYLCSSLSSINLTGLTYLENDSFRGCSSLTTISMPNCTYIGGGSFRACTSLLSITFANNVTYIGGFMCNECINLTLVQLPSNMTQLMSSFFKGCTSLTSVTIPSTVTTIQDEVFRSTGITSISIPSAVTEIGTDAFTNSLLASITFEPNSLLTTLGGGCFNNCKLVTIDIPDSCTTIKSNVFMNISTISSIIIGTGILTIQDAFTTSTNNYTITIKATTPPSFAKSSSRKPTAIYVPSSSVSAYLSASGWSSWADVIQAIPT